MHNNMDVTTTLGVHKVRVLHLLLGRIRFIEVCLTGPDSVGSSQTVCYKEGFVISKLTSTLYRLLFNQNMKLAG